MVKEDDEKKTSEIGAEQKHNEASMSCECEVCGETVSAKNPNQNAAEEDNYLTFLTSEYKKTRMLTLIFAVIGFSIFLASIALSQAGIIEVRIFNLMMSIANMFIILFAILFITKTRKMKKRLKEYRGEKSKIIDEDAPDGVRITPGQMRDMDDMYKIFERDVRTEVVPQTEEYLSMRRTWLLLMGVGAILALAAVVAYALRPDWGVATTIVLVAAFVVIIVGFYFDRTKMKPLRDEWTSSMGMSEMTYRDNMHKGKSRQQEK